MARLFIDDPTHYHDADSVRTKYANFVGYVATDTPRRPGTKSLGLNVGGYYASTKKLPVRPTYYIGFAAYFDEPFHIRLRRYNDIQCTWNVEQDLDDTWHIRVKRDDTVLVEHDITDLCNLDEWYYFEVKVTVDDTDGATATRINGIEIPELTGVALNTKGSADYADLDEVAFYGDSLYQDIYIDDDAFLGDMIVDTLWIAGGGHHSQWSPSEGVNWENVDDRDGIDWDATFNSSPNQGAKDSFALDPLPSRPDSAIKSVGIHLVARKDGAGGRIVKAFLRLATVDHIHPEDGLFLSELYHGLHQLWDANPATLEEWTEGAINGLEAGYLLTAGD